MRGIALTGVAVLALASAAVAGGSSMGGADVATGRGSATPCPPGTQPPLPFPGFCSTSPRDFRFAAVSTPGGTAAGFFWQAGTFCSAPGAVSYTHLTLPTICSV